MNKKLPIYILVIYFIFVLIILALQLLGDKNNKMVSVKLNERLKDAVVIYDDSPVMLKGSSQTFIDGNNVSQTPVVENNITYLPLAFYNSGFEAITSYNEKKSQITIKYDNKALVMNVGEKEAVLSDAERDKKVKIEYAPKLFDGGCYVPVRTFADVFGFQLFYYDGLIIISNIENIFDAETETEAIDEVIALVYNLPAAGSYDMVKSMGPEEKKAEAENEEENNFEYFQDGGEKQLYLYCEDDRGNVYYVDGGRVIKADNLPYGQHNKLSELVLPAYFSAEEINYFQDYVFVSGTKEDKAAFCLIDMTGDYGVIRKYAAAEGTCRGTLCTGGYLYFCTFSYPSENPAEENGFVPVNYENVRYFPEVQGSGILNICGINLEKLSEPVLISSFFGTDGSFTFCESGIYAAETDPNSVYGDSGEAHTNIYKLCFENGSVNFQRKTRIEGEALLTAEERPLFITKNSDDTSNIYVLDSLLDVNAVNSSLEISPQRLAEGKNRIFALQNEGIYVIDSKNGDVLGSLPISDEKMYLYSDTRIIGFSEITPEEGTEPNKDREPSEAAAESSGENTASEKPAEASAEEQPVYPSVKMTMYDISDPNNVKIISEEIIDNTDGSMLEELKIESGNGIVIIPVKIRRDGELYDGLYSYIENSYYGLSFQGEI